MGYKREPKQFRLHFGDEDMAGLEVLVGSLTIRKFMKLTAMAAGMGSALQAVQGGERVDLSGLDGLAGSVDEMFSLFAGALISWNLEDEEGKPVPADLDGIMDQEAGFIQQIIAAWMTAIAGVAPPLPGSSNGGGTLTEESLDLASFSTSLPS